MLVVRYVIRAVREMIRAEHVEPQNVSNTRKKVGR